MKETIQTPCSHSNQSGGLLQVDPLQATSHKVWRHFGCHNEKDATGYLVSLCYICFQTSYNTQDGPPTKSCPSSNVNDADY